MKISAAIISLFLGFSLSAQAAEVIKTCKTILKMPDDPKTVETTIDILSEGNTHSSKLTQIVEGRSVTYSDVAEVTEDSVNADLKDLVPFVSSMDDLIIPLNLSEKLILHAMILTKDPVMQGAFSAGFDLNQVRWAKVYMVGKPTRMGMSAIVEAKDEAGKNLGSFLGGFLVTPCK